MFKVEVWLDTEKDGRLYLKGQLGDGEKGSVFDTCEATNVIRKKKPKMKPQTLSKV